MGRIQIYKKKKLDLLKQCIKGWNNEIFGNVKEEKQRLHTSLLKLDSIEEGKLNGEIRRERYETKQQLEYIVFKEDVICRQKAKVHWAKEGDCNSKIFHQIVKGRLGKNTINRLEIDDGSIVEDEAAIENQILKFFQQFYSKKAYCKA